MLILQILMVINIYLLWKVYNTLIFMSATPNNEDLWDIFSEYLSQEDPEEEW
jgi:hypothetical protein